MKKILCTVACFLVACAVIAGPHDGRGGHGGGRGGWGGGPGCGGNRGYGLWQASQIVGIVANGMYIANQLNQPQVVYQQPVQVVQQQPVYVQQPQVVYQQQPVYVQPQPTYVVPVQPTVIYQPNTVVVQPRRKFILFRVIDAVLQ